MRGIVLPGPHKGEFKETDHHRRQRNIALAVVLQVNGGAYALQPLPEQRLRLVDEEYVFGGVGLVKKPANILLTHLQQLDPDFGPSPA